jgi:LacI family transcriptional regulator
VGSGAVVTSRDVAACARVSRAAVSYVINGSRYVSPALRERVESAIRELGYSPNAIARSLSRRSTSTVGVIIPSVMSPFHAPLVKAIEETLTQHGYSCLLANTDENPEREANMLRLMVERRVDGLLLSPSSEHNRERIGGLAQRGVPIVLVSRLIEGLQVDAVACDNRTVFARAVQHLFELGRRRIGIILLPLETATHRERLEGYVQAHASAGLAIDPSLVRVGAFTVDSGEAEASALLRLNPSADALIACNQFMSIGTLRAARGLNRRVPEDVAIVGMDDFPWTGELCPPLTVVKQPIGAIGTAAAQLLLERMKQTEPPHGPQQVLLDAELIVRVSCGAPPGRRTTVKLESYEQAPLGLRVE